MDATGTAPPTSLCRACREPIPTDPGHRRHGYCTTSCFEWHREHPGEVRVRRACERCGQLMPLRSKSTKRWCSTRCKEARKRDPWRDRLGQVERPPDDTAIEDDLLPWLMTPDLDVPEPLPEPPAWAADAACLGMPTELWFPPRGVSTDAGLAVCERCPVRGPCGDFAVSERLEFGTWGGVTERARRPVIADQPAPARVTPRRWCACGCRQPLKENARRPVRDACQKRLEREHRGAA